MMTLCNRIMEGEHLAGGLSLETIIKIAGAVGIWLIVLLLWRRR